MKSNVALEELLGVLNKIREQQYPDIPESLLREIVETEYGNQDDPVEARKASRRIIDNFLKNAVIYTEEG